MYFCTKFRLNKKIRKKQAIDKFISDIDNFILKCSYKFILPISTFEEWKYNLVNEFKSFINLHLNSNKYEYQKMNREDLNFITELHKNFIITPVDKAGTNYAIICKKFYIENVFLELNNDKYYTTVKEKPELIVKKFMAFNKKIKKSFNCNTTAVSNIFKFPFIFLTPKFHKNPVKFRYICSTVNSIGRCFSVRLCDYLKRIYGFLKNKFKNTSYFWIIENSNDVVFSLKHIPVPESFNCYDFENLFSNISIDLLYTTLKNIFVTFEIETELNIDKEFFLTLCHFCLYNNYIVFNGNFFLTDLWDRNGS